MSKYDISTRAFLCLLFLSMMALTRCYPEGFNNANWINHLGLIFTIYSFGYLVGEICELSQKLKKYQSKEYSGEH